MAVKKRRCLNCQKLTDKPRVVEMALGRIMNPLCPNCAGFARKILKYSMTVPETPKPCTCGEHRDGQ